MGWLLALFCSLSTCSNAKTHPTVGATEEIIHGWRIRPADVSDKEQASQVIQRAFQETCQTDYDPKTLRLAAAMISIPQNELLTSGTWYVAEHLESGDIVGCGGYKYNKYTNKPNDPVVKLEQFAADPKYPGAKIGSALWEKTQKEIQQDTRVTTTGSTATPLAEMEVVSTLTAQPFYEKKGFETIQRVNVPILLEDFPCVLMRRNLALN